MALGGYWDNRPGWWPDNTYTGNYQYTITSGNSSNVVWNGSSLRVLPTAPYDPQPAEESAVEWLRRRVDEICDSGKLAA